MCSGAEADENVSVRRELPRVGLGRGLPDVGRVYARHGLDRRGREALPKFLNGTVEEF